MQNKVQQRIKESVEMKLISSASVTIRKLISNSTVASGIARTG